MLWLSFHSAQPTALPPSGISYADRVTGTTVRHPFILTSSRLLEVRRDREVQSELSTVVTQVDIGSVIVMLDV